MERKKEEKETEPLRGTESES